MPRFYKQPYSIIALLHLELADSRRRRNGMTLMAEASYHAVHWHTHVRLQFMLPCDEAGVSWQGYNITDICEQVTTGVIQCRLQRMLWMQCGREAARMWRWLAARVWANLLWLAFL